MKFFGLEVQVGQKLGRAVACRVPEGMNAQTVMNICGQIAGRIRQSCEMQNEDGEVERHHLRDYAVTDRHHRWDIYPGPVYQTYCFPSYHVAFWRHGNGIREVIINLWA